MDDLTINDNLTIPGWELWFTATTSGGPGGQHANKAATRVTLHWSVDDSSVLSARQKSQLSNRLSGSINDDGVLTVSCGETRSQHRNRKVAREQLAATLRKALAKRKRRVKTKPSRAARRRRLEEKRQRSKLKKTRKNPRPKDWD